jgi:dihydrolipoamide dehydrogenase
MEYDLIILGGGPGGYVAAERAGERGKKVLLIEQEHLGGVCLNWGCVPTKTLLNSGKTFYNAQHGETLGVLGGNSLRFDFAQAQKRKQDIIDGLRKGVAGLMKKNKVTVVNGRGHLLDAQTVQINDTSYQGQSILICTGSRPAKPPIPGIDGSNVVDSTGLLAQEEPPASLAIVGGGVIGCEFACFFAQIGVPVTVVEMLPEICPGIDADLSNMLRQQLEKKGVAFHCGAKVQAIDDMGLQVETSKGQQRIDATLVLVSTGRLPNIEDIGLEAAGVAVDKRRIVIDDHCRTNIPNIYAAGDVTGKALLAHAASRQGEVAVDHLCGGSQRMRYHAIPGVVYTSPEVACVGISEAEAKKKGRNILVAKTPLAASGRFLAENTDPRGLLKVIVDADTRAIIGMHMIGNLASEIVHAATTMIEAELRSDEVTELCLAHPTVGELLKDCLFQLH